LVTLVAEANDPFASDVVQATILPALATGLALASASCALMVTALTSGRMRWRRLHLFAGPATMLALAVAVVFTEQLVRSFTFPAEEMRIHLFCAKSAGFLALPVIVTGVFLWRWPRLRKLHLVCVLTFVGMALVATATGVWVFSLATPK